MTLKSEKIEHKRRRPCDCIVLAHGIWEGEKKGKYDDYKIEIKRQKVQTPIVAMK